MDTFKSHRRRLIQSVKGCRKQGLRTARGCRLQGLHPAGLHPVKGLRSAGLSPEGAAQQQAALRETVAALEEVMALYGRLRLAPYPYEHMVWRTARKALLEGKKALVVAKKPDNPFGKRR
ncbi:hypothetical protein HER14_04125 [Acidithiobacillus thiooxidans]|uniref:hypothetical protein n=1 Tax=Acidithiobacillus thiooxidans TaxID=930 RepID=UPI001C07C2EC|nr:hypothetical protein [Acidithiobacillus thiooxidans]MBU2750146.1 hypothetical protein [Acidithiobacillus thiooxidans]